MKTNHIFTAIATAIFLAAQVSCTKEMHSPGGGGDGLGVSSSVSTESWFAANWQSANSVYEFTKSISNLNAELLNNGKVLVFGKGGFEQRYATSLPATFDGNFIGFASHTGSMDFILQGNAAISQSLQFRYIIIAADKLAPAGTLDYSNYHAVCSYYKLAE